MDSELFVTMSIFIFFIVLYAVPSIVWLSFGIRYEGTVCTKDSKSVKAESPTWLIVKGVVGILQAVALIILVIVYFKCRTTPCLILAMFAIVLLLISFLFEFGWLIYGGVVLFDDRTCFEANQPMITTMIVALILGIMASVGGLSKFIFSDDVQRTLFGLDKKIGDVSDKRKNLNIF